MPDLTMVSFRTDKEMERRLRELAKATDRPKSWHIKDALREYLELHAWQTGEINKGLEDVKTGRLVDHEDVANRLESWGVSDEDKIPE